MQQVLETLPLSIQKLTSKGYGAGFLPSGKEIEVAHAIPGDEILLAWKKKKRPPQKGRLLQVLSPSPDRVDPRCAHARLCGGCSWQQMSYEAQLRQKEERVCRAFSHRFPIAPILPCETPFGYRNKMEFTFSENRGGTRYLGLMIAQAEPYVFDVLECHLAPSWFSTALAKVRKWWEESKLPAYRPAEDSGVLRYLTLRQAMRTGQKMAILNTSCPLSQGHLEGWVAAMRSLFSSEEPLSLFLRIHQTKKGRPTHFEEIHLFGPDHIVEELHIREKKLSFKISPSSFFQPNTAQAEKLYNVALEMMGFPALVYDLYCGTGTLTLAAALQAQRAVGIELCSEAIRDAQENSQRNHVDNVAFFQGDVGKVITQQMSRSDFQRPDAIVVDPPRAGLDPLAIHHLTTILKAQKIVYVSCNPLTQAANINDLLKAGYRLDLLQPVDLFPHTYHVENIALLVR